MTHLLLTKSKHLRPFVAALVKFRELADKKIGDPNIGFSIGKGQCGSC